MHVAGSVLWLWKDLPLLRAAAWHSTLGLPDRDSPALSSLCPDRCWQINPRSERAILPYQFSKTSLISSGKCNWQQPKGWIFKNKSENANPFPTPPLYPFSKPEASPLRLCWLVNYNDPKRANWLVSPYTHSLSNAVPFHFRKGKYDLWAKIQWMSAFWLLAKPRLYFHSTTGFRWICVFFQILLFLLNYTYTLILKLVLK